MAKMKENGWMEFQGTECENDYFSNCSLEFYFTNTLNREMDSLRIFENFTMLYVLNLYFYCPR